MPDYELKIVMVQLSTGNSTNRKRKMNPLLYLTLFASWCQYKWLIGIGGIMFKFLKWI